MVLERGRGDGEWRDGVEVCGSNRGWDDALSDDLWRGHCFLKGRAKIAGQWWRVDRCGALQVVKEEKRWTEKRGGLIEEGDWFFFFFHDFFLFLAESGKGGGAQVGKGIIMTFHIWKSIYVHYFTQPHSITYTTIIPLLIPTTGKIKHFEFSRLFVNFFTKAISMAQGSLSFLHCEKKEGKKRNKLHFNSPLPLSLSLLSLAFAIKIPIIISCHQAYCWLAYCSHARSSPSTKVSRAHLPCRLLSDAGATMRIWIALGIVSRWAHCQHR